MKKVDKDYVLQRIGKSLDIQFELYSWEKMLEDTFLPNEKKELKYAKEHIGYKAYITD
jgi:hypothetical protein